MPESHSRARREASWPFSMLPGPSPCLPGRAKQTFFKSNRPEGPNRPARLFFFSVEKKKYIFIGSRHCLEVARGAMGDAPEELPWGLDAKKLQKVVWRAGSLCSAFPPPARASSVQSAMLRARISAASGMCACYPVRRGLRLTGGCLWLVAGLQGTTNERQDQGVPDRHTGRWFLFERALSGVVRKRLLAAWGAQRTRMMTRDCV